MSEQLLQSAVYLLEQLVSCVYCMMLEHPKQTTVYILEQLVSCVYYMILEHPKQTAVYILEQLAMCMQVYKSSYGGQLSAFKGDNRDKSDLLL